ncbi:MAG: hypothetical protein AAFU80_25225 [Pseudomonadota bacterium]
MLALLTLGACSPPDADLAERKDPIGEFRLGYNIVVADEAREVEPSRTATPDEWERAFQNAIEERFGRYDGSQLYHVSVLVDGYSIAPTGIPGLVTTQSLVVIGVYIWDDAAGGRINDEIETITVWERVGGSSGFLGSGATLSREEQIENLAKNAARLIEVWLRKNPDWFAARPGAASTVRIENNQVVGSSGEGAGPRPIETRPPARDYVPSAPLPLWSYGPKPAEPFEAGP